MSSSALQPEVKNEQSEKHYIRLEAEYFLELYSANPAIELVPDFDGQKGWEFEVHNCGPHKISILQLPEPGNTPIDVEKNIPMIVVAEKGLECSIKNNAENDNEKAFVKVIVRNAAAKRISSPSLASRPR